MNGIEIYKNAEFGEVRTYIDENGEVMFCGKDVATALGYKNTNRALKAHCRKDEIKKHLFATNGGRQELNCISERNLCRLITHSKLPSAEKFEDWLFDEILPSVRQASYKELLQMFKAERERNKKLELLFLAQKQMIAEKDSRIDYRDVILIHEKPVSFSEIAKDYGITTDYLKDFLADKNILFSKKGKQFLRPQYANQGYTVTEIEDDEVSVKWTQKGRLFLYRLLKENSILPIIEKEGYHE